MTQRIYKVTNKTTNAIRLVEASNGPQAIRHVVQTEYEATPATALETVKKMDEGVKVEKAGTIQVDLTSL